MPWHACLVDDPCIQELLSRAVKLACDEVNHHLRGLDPDAPVLEEPALALLKEHLSALLQGLPASGAKPGSPLPALLGSVQGLGHVRAPRTSERVTVATVSQGTAKLLFFQEGGFVPLAKLAPASLSSTPLEALQAAYAWLGQTGQRPMDYALRLCLVNFSKDGRAELSELA